MVAPDVSMGIALGPGLPISDCGFVMSTTTSNAYANRAD